MTFCVPDWTLRYARAVRKPKQLLQNAIARFTIRSEGRSEGKGQWKVAGHFSVKPQATPMTDKEARPLSSLNWHYDDQLHLGASWHHTWRHCFEPSQASLPPQHKAGPMLAHRPSAITPTPQAVRTIGMWRICPTVPLAVTVARSTAFSLS
jgi:hypothetical protein